MASLPASTEHGVDGDVIVVTACAPTHHGVSVHLVEKRTEPREASRANNLRARVQEMREPNALRDPLAEESCRMRGYGRRPAQAERPG